MATKKSWKRSGSCKSMVDLNEFFTEFYGKFFDVDIGGNNGVFSPIT